MKTFLRWTIRIIVTLLFVCVVLMVLFILLKDVLAKNLAEKGLRDGTGMDARIAKMEIGLATPTISMEGLKIYNPPDFGGGTLLDLPELRMEYDPDAVGRGKVGFKTMRIHLAELHVVKDKNGVSNLDLLEKHSRQRKRDPKDKDRSLGDSFSGIDVLYLTIDRVRMTDLGDPRKNQVINVGIKDEEMKNMKSEEDLKARFLLALVRVMLTNPELKKDLTPLLSPPRKPRATP